MSFFHFHKEIELMKNTANKITNLTNYWQCMWKSIRNIQTFWIQLVIYSILLLLHYCESRNENVKILKRWPSTCIKWLSWKRKISVESGEDWLSKWPLAWLLPQERKRFWKVKKAANAAHQCLQMKSERQERIGIKSSLLLYHGFTALKRFGQQVAYFDYLLKTLRTQTLHLSPAKSSIYSNLDVGKMQMLVYWFWLQRLHLNMHVYLLLLPANSSEMLWCCTRDMLCITTTLW